MGLVAQTRTIGHAELRTAGRRPCPRRRSGYSSLKPLKLIIRDEVHHARNGVGTIHRGGAAGNDVDPFQDHLRDHVDVDRAVRRGRRNAVAVEQDQGAHRAQVAQVQLVAGRVAAAGHRGAAAARIRGLGTRAGKDGQVFRASAIVVGCTASMSCARTAVTGVGLLSPLTMTREPVTTTDSIFFFQRRRLPVAGAYPSAGRAVGDGRLGLAQQRKCECKCTGQQRVSGKLFVIAACECCDFIVSIEYGNLHFLSVRGRRFLLHAFLPRMCAAFI
jgi:hypothetical protein